MKTGTLLLPILLAAAISAQAVDLPETHGKKIVSNTVNPLLMLRVNDRISAMNQVVFDDGQHINRWDGFDCTTNKAVKLYWEMLDDKEVVMRRFYGDSYNRYAEPKPQSELDDVAKNLCQAPRLHNPSWVYIEKKSKYDTPILVDTASVLRVNKVLIAKIGFEYSEITFDPPYDAPYDMKIEVHGYNCETQHDVVMAGLDITPEGYVSDSLTGKAAQRRAEDFTSTPATTAAFKQLCAMSTPSAFKGEGVYVPSTKKKSVSSLGRMLPDFSNNSSQWMAQFPLPADIEKQALQIVNPWAKPRFKKLTWNMQWSDNDVVPMQLDVQPNGLMLLLENYKMFKAQRLTLGNLGQLKGAISLSYTPTVISELHTNLRFPLHQGQTFTFDTVAPKTDKDEKNTVINRRCEVTGSDDARQVSSALSGRYWKVACEIESDGDTQKETLAWLSDLNVFMPLTQWVKGKEVPVNVTNVEVTR
ncbi:hypothetical protein E0L21_23755 [Kosakonia quasisacchari]|uniref:DUF3857 domain-containing protein n=1 Tax=Kosakonia quasisacchari TaxID=2529380 RepID=A0A4R0GHT1_9ENTR|nr:hypothetical protein [Kosakonia quasisacchari]TCB96686.1 hypothetical protein E0L21_23755 [Kosakonia quasisacchari]